MSAALFSLDGPARGAPWPAEPAPFYEPGRAGKPGRGAEPGALGEPGPPPRHVRRRERHRLQRLHRLHGRRAHPGAVPRRALRRPLQQQSQGGRRGAPGASARRPRAPLGPGPRRSAPAQARARLGRRRRARLAAARAGGRVRTDRGEPGGRRAAHTAHVAGAAAQQSRADTRARPRPGEERRQEGSGPRQPRVPAAARAQQHRGAQEPRQGQAAQPGDAAEAGGAVGREREAAPARGAAHAGPGRPPAVLQAVAQPALPAGRRDRRLSVTRGRGGRDSATTHTSDPTARSGARRAPAQPEPPVTRCSFLGHTSAKKLQPGLTTTELREKLNVFIFP
uniref:Uncharacterized protein n=1 Tax=Macaca fascicularis TaxID=9541 RepID=A0A2K5UE57_MACFA